MSMASDAWNRQFEDEGPFLKPIVTCHTCGNEISEDAAWGSSHDFDVRFCGAKCVSRYHDSLPVE